MEYNISKPSSELSHIVKHYWTLESCIPYGKDHVQRIVPNGLFELIFYFDDQPEILKKGSSLGEITLISGQIKEYYDIKVTGKLSLFSIIFQPYGLVKLFDIPLIELLNQNVPLKYLIKDAVVELETKLFEARSFHDRIVIAENFLIQQLKRSKEKYQFNRIKNSIDKINRTKGLVSIDSLALEACYSRKQFERVFSDYIGASPKQFLMIVRFQNAIHEKSVNKDINLTSLAYQCGYFDQSHMTNDFLKLSGMTPKQYFNDCEPFSDYFQL